MFPSLEVVPSYSLQMGKLNANKVAWLLWRENVSSSNYLSFSNLALFMKRALLLVCSYQLLDFESRRKLRIGEFYLAGY